MKKKKKLGLNKIYSLLKEGLNPAQINKQYNVPKQTLSYSVGKLIKMGSVQKLGYGTYECIKDPKEVPKLTTTHSTKSTQKIGTSPKKEIRGHAFIWKIEFVSPYNWNKVIKNYSKKTLTFQLMKHNKVWRTIFNNRKIWLNLKGLTIYEPIDFLGKSSFEVKGKAVYEMDLLIKGLLKELNLKFKNYRFTTSREHYGIIKNELARQYNDKKEKMAIRSEDGNLWMWIDDSLSLGELENNQPNINREVQNFWNNHKKHKFQIDADFVLNGMAKQNEAILKNTENLDYHAENMKSHVGAVRQLGTNVNEQTDLIKKQNLILEKLLKKLN